jgi:hypothetical protein
MTKAQYEGFEALDPFFGVVMEGIRELHGGSATSTCIDRA